MAQIVYTPDAAARRPVAIYARQSEDVSEGIERQLQRCALLADAKGWEVVEQYVDNDTSASKRRDAGTAWARMLADAARGRFEVVVAVDLDRLLRDVRDLTKVIDTGVAVLTVDGEIDLTTADGEFRATMLAAIARFEVRRKGERYVRANEQRASSGKPIPTRRRYGYETDGRTPRPNESVVVRRMFGHILDGGSIRSLALALTAEGVDPAPGKEWSPRRVRDILTNEHYGGMLRYKGVASPSEHIQPIVDPEHAAEVRAILADPTRKTSRGPKPSHLGSFTTYCGECGAPLKFMREYLCSARATRPTVPHATIKAHLLEPVLVREIATALLTTDPDAFGATPDNAARTKHARDEYARVEAALSYTSDDRDHGRMPLAMARARMAALNAELSALEAKLEGLRLERAASSSLAEVAHELLGPGPEWTRREFDSTVAAVGERFSALDMDKQRDMLRALVHVEVARGSSTSRIRVTHLIAEHLNPDREVFD